MRTIATSFSMQIVRIFTFHVNSVYFSIFSTLIPASNIATNLSTWFNEDIKLITSWLIAF